MQGLFTVLYTAAQWLLRHSLHGLYIVVYTAAQWLPLLFHARPLHSSYCSSVTPASLALVHARPLQSGLCCITVTPASIPWKAFSQWFILLHSDSCAAAVITQKATWILECTCEENAPLSPLPTHTCAWHCHFMVTLHNLVQCTSAAVVLFRRPFLDISLFELVWGPCVTSCFFGQSVTSCFFGQSVTSCCFFGLLLAVSWLICDYLLFRPICD
jgi:hypothetical protein